MPRARQEKGGVDLRKLPHIFFRRLGREQVHGRAFHPMFSEITPIENPALEVDATLTGMRRLEIIVHEALHLALPALPESAVRLAGKYVAKVLWHLQYKADEDWQNEHYGAPDSE